VRIVFDEEHVVSGALPILLRAGKGAGKAAGKPLTLAEFEALKNAPAGPTNDGAAYLRADALLHEGQGAIVLKLTARMRKAADYSITEPILHDIGDLIPTTDDLAGVRVARLAGQMGLRDLDEVDRVLWARLVRSLGPRKSLRLVLELRKLECKISDFFEAARRCETDSVRAVMHFLALERYAGKEDG